MKGLEVATKRGTVLNGVIFDSENAADTVLIAITGIHGNFYSNPFYFNIGETLSANGIDFVYAQTNDAFGQIETYNAKTGEKEIIGSWNERFSYTDEDIESYLKFAEKNYKHIILAGHSLGANKVIYYLSNVEKSLKNVQKMISRRKLISPIEICFAFEFNSVDEVIKFIDPLIVSNEIKIIDVNRGLFIKSNY